MATLLAVFAEVDGCIPRVDPRVPPKTLSGRFKQPPLQTVPLFTNGSSLRATDVADVSDLSDRTKLIFFRSYPDRPSVPGFSLGRRG